MADDVFVDVRSEDRPIKARQTSSDCYYFASATCYLPIVYVCAGSRIYNVNEDTQNRGLHGCDPHSGYIGTGYTSYPSSCCRIASNGAAEKDVDDG
ncbi:hypothetical protein CGLO_04170 [Colletotrichum gloeosporioides Cg-14]|uniref:Uncharacterized protein n=1 Tax=Colletotrichum gloeosporioides (strain Cg-14) TaxID=1237896 RepID=T0LVR0_COLGC|nr:hypothetical protein CGLO_04170 [Colletotrichum gloeosporioides Cg-14]